MLGTATYRLHRSPHVTVTGNQIPAGGNELIPVEWARMRSVRRASGLVLAR